MTVCYLIEKHNEWGNQLKIIDLFVISDRLSEGFSSLRSNNEQRTNIYKLPELLKAKEQAKHKKLQLTL